MIVGLVDSPLALVKLMLLEPLPLPSGVVLHIRNRALQTATTLFTKPTTTPWGFEWSKTGHVLKVPYWTFA